MYRLMKMSKKWYGIEFEEVIDDEENINQLVSEGDIVILVADLEDFKYSDFYNDEEIIIV